VTEERERKISKRQGPKSRQASSPKEAGHKEEREPLRTQGPKSRQASSPNEAGHKEEREPLRTQAGKGTTKNRTLHQSHEAYKLKRGGGKPNKTPSSDGPSLAVTARLKMEAAWAQCVIC